MGYFPPANNVSPLDMIAQRFVATDALSNIWLVESPGTTAPTLSGTNNTIFGSGGVGSNLTDAYSNVIGGYKAALNATRIYESVVIGDQAGLNLGTSGRHTAVGSLALQNHSGATGVSETALGRAALNHDVNGGYNVGAGHAALYYLNGDFGDGVTYTGSFNTGTGNQAGAGVISGNNIANNCCYHGASSGVGTNPAFANQSGDNCCYFGAYSGPNSATQRSNVTCVGYGSGAGADGAIAIGYLAVNTLANSCLIGQSGQAMKFGVGTIPSFDFDIALNNASDGVGGARFSYVGSDAAFTSFGQIVMIRTIPTAGSTSGTILGSYMTAGMSIDTPTPLQFNASQITTKITAIGTRSNSSCSLLFKAKAIGSTGLPSVEDMKLEAGVISAMQAGGGFAIKEGANCCQGVATLVAGTVTVNNTQAITGRRITHSHATAGGVQGILSHTINTGVSFTINSTSAADTSTVNWEIKRPAA